MDTVTTINFEEEKKLGKNYVTLVSWTLAVLSDDLFFKNGSKTKEELWSTMSKIDRLGSHVFLNMHQAVLERLIIQLCVDGNLKLIQWLFQQESNRDNSIFANPSSIFVEHILNISKAFKHSSITDWLMSEWKINQLPEVNEDLALEKCQSWFGEFPSRYPNNEPIIMVSKTNVKFAINCGIEAMTIIGLEPDENNIFHWNSSQRKEMVFMFFQLIISFADKIILDDMLRKIQRDIFHVIQQRNGTGGLFFEL